MSRGSAGALPEMALRSTSFNCSRSQKRSNCLRSPSRNSTRLQTQASWLSIPTSWAARAATSSRISSDSKASTPIMEIEVFGSNETSCRPGIRYWMTLLMASPPPQATILSKYCGR